jgi:hypothetical protein
MVIPEQKSGGDMPYSPFDLSHSDSDLPDGAPDLPLYKKVIRLAFSNGLSLLIKIGGILDYFNGAGDDN